MSTEAPPDQSAVALERYAAMIRRARLRYFTVIAAVVVAASVVTTVVWLSGEISHTTLRTSAAPADIPLGTPSATLTKAWSTTDAPAIGTPYWNGTVITADTHTVRGRNGRTGAQTWSYTRTDRKVCAAAQSEGTTVAVYQVNGNCDELTALDSSTGARKWNRTLDLDGHMINGSAAIDIWGSTITFRESSVIYAIDLGSGYNDWLYSETGCTINGSVLGSAGDLISQTCSGRDCTNVKPIYCGNGNQLFLRNGTAGENTDSTKNNGNPDQVIWTRQNLSAVPAAAGVLITALNPDGTTLSVFDSKKGTTLHTLGLAPAALPASVVGAVNHADAVDAEIVWLNGTTYAISSPGESVRWSAPTSVVPTAESSAGDIAGGLNDALLTVPTASGAARLDGQTGKVSATYSISTTPAAAVFPYGTGFIVSASTVTVYR